jgi:glycosyltransferase involved in cell wall biosynthesis
MALHYVFDITRLVTRMLNKTPNGIDRVDFAFARHFLDEGKDSSGLLTSFLGPRLFPRGASLAAVEGIGKHWGEAEDPESDIAYRQVVCRLAGEGPPALAKTPVSRGRSGQARGTWQWMRTYGAPIGASLRKHVPHGACYINVSQFPLWIASYFGWLKERRDVKAIFFIHDLLPIERPEFFRPAEYERHKRRLENLAAFGHAAITSTTTVRNALAKHMGTLGRPDMPIFALPPPVAPVFYERSPIDPRLSKHPYFVCCSTIEPRKNHLLLLHVWRELVGRCGADAPKLVLIGNRGWENENAVDLLERCVALQDHVIEVSGLSTPALKRLLDGARALLMPSFAEGYGLPLAEALAAGVPVIASDIPVFHEIGHGLIQTLSPIAGDRWLEAILARAVSPLSPQMVAEEDKFHPMPEGWKSYFAQIDGFLADL